MPRRYAADHMMRREVRDGFGTPRTEVDAWVSLLGTNLVALWHADFGYAPIVSPIDTWTDQVGGRVMQAPSAPQDVVRAADGSFFGGRKVVQTAISGLHVLRGSGFSPPLAVTNDLPCVFVRARHRTTGANRYLTDDYSLSSNRSTTHSTNAASRWMFTNVTTSNAVSLVSDTNVHTAIGWIDGTLIHIDVDGAETSAADTFVIAGNQTSLSFGVFNLDGTSGPADGSLAIVGFLASDPGPSVRAAIRALCAAQYPS